MDRPLELLRRIFGHGEFRGPQRDIIEHMQGGGQSLVIMPTGMGKSLCYQIPALMDDGLTLVISPLIALMKDQVDSLQRRGVDACFINSSLEREQREVAYEALAAGQFRLLYVTPERFRKPAFLEAIARRRVSLLAIDEAHCISEWGHDFRPDYSRLGELRRIVGSPPTIALTATATLEVQADIQRQLGFDESPDFRLFHEGIARPNLRLDVVKVWNDDDKLGEILRVREAQPGSGIVYFTLIKTLERFSERLSALGLPHAVYHGRLEPKERRRLQERFMGGEDELVLATNAFGMGVDKADIRSVVHAEIPGSIESYYQEIGRAGRDGEPALCRMLYVQEDLLTQMQFLEWSNPSPDDYSRLYRILGERQEELSAFGFEWLQREFHPRGRHDHRLETALGMLERYGAITGQLDPFSFELTGELPARLIDADQAAEKLRRSRERLYRVVEYSQYEGSRLAFFNGYFGLDEGSGTAPAGVSLRERLHELPADVGCGDPESEDSLGLPGGEGDGVA